MVKAFLGLRSNFVSYLQQKNFVQFKNNKQKGAKTMLLIFVIAVICLSLIVLVDNTGFNNISTLWAVNKKVILIIALGSFSLGISSFLVQQASKNKLADSSVLGLGNINLVTLMVLIFALDFNSPFSVSNYKFALPFAFTIVSMGAAILIFWLSSRKSIQFNKKFIIMGVVLNFVFVAISFSLQSFLPAGKQVVVLRYINGFFDSTDDFFIITAAILFAVGIVWLFLISEKIRIVNTNAEIAKELGINPTSINAQTLGLTGLFMACSFILVGNVAFLGLVGGNLATYLFKKDYRYAMPASGYISIIIVALTFLINKNLLESNINTAQLIPLVSLPYFIYMILRN